MFALPIVTTKVCTLSQPDAFKEVSEYEPEVVMICPFQSKLSHTVNVVEL